MRRYPEIEPIVMGPKIVCGWERGYSLIELLVVVGLMGVVASIAIPAFIDLAPRMRLKSAARNIVSDMQLARTKALRDSSTWAIQFDTGTDAGYRVLSDDGADDTWNTSDDLVYKSVKLSNYTNISYGNTLGDRPDEPNPGASDAISFTDNRVVFNSDGTSVSGTVYVKNGNDDTFAIGSLSAAGRIKTWHNYGSGWEG